jgi:cytochrome c5
MSRDTRRYIAPVRQFVALMTAAALVGCARDDGGAPKRSSAVATTEDAARIAPPPPAALSARTSAEEQASLRMLPAGTGHDLVVGKCLVCHAAAMITQQHKDTTGWNKTVTQMIAWGAPVAKEQQVPLVAYLAEHFPARTAGAPAGR